MQADRRVHREATVEELCAKCIVFNAFALGLSEKQIRRFVGNVDSEKNQWSRWNRFASAQGRHAILSAHTNSS
jgi:hypothetical protein